MDFEWMKFPQVADVFDEAVTLAGDNDSSVVTEWHLLLSLLRFDSVWKSFTAPEKLRERLWETAESVSDGALNPGKKPEWQPKFRNRILTEAERLRSDADESLPLPSHFASALFDFGSPKLREIMEKFGFGKGDAAEKRDNDSSGGNRHLPKSDVEALERFTVELVARAAKNPLPSVFGRRAETDALMRTLTRRRKCCPVLVGRPGVGKTAVVEVLARRIAEGDVPAAMKNCRIYSLNTGSLIAGASYRGQYEGRLRAVVNAVKKQSGGILFVDELHALLNSGANHDDALTAGNILKPELASGELRFIGATTEDEYRRFIEADGAMERRFTPIQVREPGKDECLEMLRQCRGTFETYYHAKFTDELFGTALELACRYIPQRALPDKVFDVLDEAGADHLLNGGKDGTELSVERLEAAVAHAARLPHLPKGAADALAPLRTLNDALKHRVFGQDAAVAVLCRAVKLAESGFDVAERGTRGNFFFNGTTGVGKTELARSLAETLAVPLVKFDMSEYSSEYSVSRLIGAAPGLVGYDEGGALVNAVRENPHCVLLLDEFEKAHPAVHRLLLQVMDDGVLTDSRGRRAEFRQVYLVFTGNVKSRTAAAVGFGAESKRESVLAEKFPPEFRSRLTAVVEFDALSDEILGRIVDRTFDRLRERAEAKGFTLALDDSAKTEFVRRAAARDEGARPVARLVEKFAALPLAELLIRGTRKKNMKLVYEKGGFRYE